MPFLTTLRNRRKIRRRSSPTVFDGKQVVLQSAGNETVAFQLLLQSKTNVTGVNVRMAPFDSKTQPQCDLFYEYYVLVDRGGYSWGGGMGPLPCRKRYPDALVPLYDPYATGEVRVAQGFSIDPTNGPNQAVWIDVFVPKDFPAGTYKSVLSVEAGGDRLAIPVSLRVCNFSLPDENHVESYGEMYSLLSTDASLTNSKIAPHCVDLHGDDFRKNPDISWNIYKKYIQMGHAHHLLALLRGGLGPIPYARVVNTNGVTERLTPFMDKLKLKDKLTWVDFDEWGKYYGEVLDGALFTREQGYVGPGANTPPRLFQVPFPQLWYGGDVALKYMAANGGALDEPMRRFYTGSASNFWNYVQARHWDKRRYFTYIFDECDGGNDKGAEAGSVGGESDNTRVHRMMKDTQDAIDLGAGGSGRIDLLWTSHARPGRWVGTPADISNVIRWWAPNAGGYDVDFFKELRTRKPNDTFWVYHAGQPAIGNHSVNQTGIDLMTWGLLCWKYKVNGSFWWAVTAYCNRNNPYDHPKYNGDDDRFGNGVLFYPGSRLEVLGFPNIAGPVSSFRMKSLRRGQQDYEYLWMLSQRKGSTAEADALVDAVIQAGLSKADGLKAPAWSKDPADWYTLRKHVAEAIGALSK